MEIKDIKKTDDIEEAIAERAGVDLRGGTVPVGKKLGWFGNQTFELFKTMPINDQPVSVFAMFPDADEVRVYALLTPSPQNPQPKDKEGKPIAPYQRLRLSLHAPLIFSEVFPGTEDDPMAGLECFIDEIVRELRKLAAVDEGLEAIDMLEQIEEILADKTTMASTKVAAIQKLIEGEDEPEEKPPAKPNGEAAVSPPA